MGKLIPTTTATNYPVGDTTANLINLIGTLAQLDDAERARWTAPADIKAVKAGDTAYVYSHGDMRRGVVTKIGRTRISVAYTTAGALNESRRYHPTHTMVTDIAVTMDNVKVRTAEQPAPAAVEAPAADVVDQDQDQDQPAPAVDVDALLSTTDTPVRHRRTGRTGRIAFSPAHRREAVYTWAKWDGDSRWTPAEQTAKNDLELVDDQDQPAAELRPIEARTLAAADRTASRMLDALGAAIAAPDGRFPTDVDPHTIGNLEDAGMAFAGRPTNRGLEHFTAQRGDTAARELARTAAAGDQDAEPIRMRAPEVSGAWAGAGDAGRAEMLEQAHGEALDLVDDQPAGPCPGLAAAAGTELLDAARAALAAAVSPAGDGPARYERITISRGRSLVLRDPVDVEITGCPAVAGVEVDQHAAEVPGADADVRRVVALHVSLIAARVPLVLVDGALVGGAR